MKNKVVPFPASNSQGISPEGLEGSHQLIVRVGSQRIALELSCRATVLRSAAQPTAAPRDGVNRERGKERAQ